MAVYASEQDELLALDAVGLGGRVESVSCNDNGSGVRRTSSWLRDTTAVRAVKSIEVGESAVDCLLDDGEGGRDLVDVDL